MTTGLAMDSLTERETEGVILSFGFIFLVLIFAKVFMLIGPRLSPEGIRKFVHISVCNWWFIVVAYFTRLQLVVVGPIFFILFNATAVFFKWTRHLGMNDRFRNLGLIYYPISLLILVILDHYSYITTPICGMAIFCMGYGDGFAAVLGQKFGKGKISKFSGSKTYVGSLAMFMVSLLVITGFSIWYDLEWASCPEGIVMIVLNAAIATVLEAWTPWGIDNLTVPLGTAASLCLTSSFVFPE